MFAAGAAAAAPSDVRAVADARAREDYSLSFTGHTVRTVFTILTQTGFVAPPHIDRTVGVQIVHIEPKIILRKVLAMAVEVSGYHWYAA
jgi:hypothetical protein